MGYGFISTASAGSSEASSPGLASPPQGHVAAGLPLGPLLPVSYSTFISRDGPAAQPNRDWAWVFLPQPGWPTRNHRSSGCIQGS